MSIAAMLYAMCYGKLDILPLIRRFLIDRKDLRSLVPLVVAKTEK